MNVFFTMLRPVLMMLRCWFSTSMSGIRLSRALQVGYSDSIMSIYRSVLRFVLLPSGSMRIGMTIELRSFMTVKSRVSSSTST